LDGQAVAEARLNGRRRALSYKQTWFVLAQRVVITAMATYTFATTGGDIEVCERDFLMHRIDMLPLVPEEYRHIAAVGHSLPKIIRMIKIMAGILALVAGLLVVDAVLRLREFYARKAEQKREEDDVRKGEMAMMAAGLAQKGAKK